MHHVGVCLIIMLEIENSVNVDAESQIDLFTIIKKGGDRLEPLISGNAVKITLQQAT